MKSFRQHLSESFSKSDAKELGDKLSVNWEKVDLDEFTKGLSVEKEHEIGRAHV